MDMKNLENGKNLDDLISDLKRIRNSEQRRDRIMFIFDLAYRYESLEFPTYSDSYDFIGAWGTDKIIDKSIVEMIDELDKINNKKQTLRKIILELNRLRDGEKGYSRFHALMKLREQKGLLEISSQEDFYSFINDKIENSVDYAIDIMINELNKIKQYDA